jgi:hypothetical protein
MVSLGEICTHDHLHRGMWRWRNILILNVARFGSFVLLFFAAALKADQLFTDPALGVLYGSHWVEAGIVDYEFLLSIWLLSGVRLQ